METITTPIATAQDAIDHLKIDYWDNEQKLYLAALIVLDLLPQPARVKLCCDVLDRDFFKPGT